MKKMLQLKIRQRLGANVSQVPSVDFLSKEDLHDAEKAIVRYIQQAAFPEEEITTLKRPSSVTQRLKKTSSIYHLDPDLDGDGILRVGGRLRRSAMPEHAKHPFILPKNHIVTRLILEDIHCTKGHVGRNYTLAVLTEVLGLWCPTSRFIINKCVL